MGHAGFFSEHPHIPTATGQETNLYFARIYFRDTARRQTITQYASAGLELMSIIIIEEFLLSVLGSLACSEWWRLLSLAKDTVILQCILILAAMWTEVDVFNYISFMNLAACRVPPSGLPSPHTRSSPVSHHPYL